MPMTATVTIVASCVGAALLGWASGYLVRFVARRRPFLQTVDRRCRAPWIATLVSVAALSSTPVVAVRDGLERGLRHALIVLVILSVTWLCTGVVRVAEDAALLKLRMDVANNRKIRKVRTQVAVISRVVVAVLVVIGAAAAMMTFARMRALGTSLLASAGLAGVVGGLAAQSVLGNVFAGLQLAFNDALRVDDVLVVEDEWGRVEELTLTYVVVHLWDERRMVLPTSYFTTKPFQNWTRSSARNLGSVFLYLDYTAPIEALRSEAERIVHANTLWDRQGWALQVTDATERTIQVRILASASDSGRAFQLRCDIREQLLTWINENCPSALPATRVAGAGETTPGADLARLLSDSPAR